MMPGHGLYLMDSVLTTMRGRRADLLVRWKEESGARNKVVPYGCGTIDRTGNEIIGIDYALRLLEGLYYEWVQHEIETSEHA